MQNQALTTYTMLKRVKSLLILSIIGTFIFVFDQLTKQWVLNNVSLHESISPSISGLYRLFQITYITNSGAAFGLFSERGNIFMVVALIVALAIFYYIAYEPDLPGIVRFALGLQLGGALGNMVDRMRHGWVVDFIDIGFWPIFNIADISIVCGVILLGFWMWEEENKAQALNN